MVVNEAMGGWMAFRRVRFSKQCLANESEWHNWYDSNAMRANMS
jgi:hypothetical protein